MLTDPAFIRRLDSLYLLARRVLGGSLQADVVSALINLGYQRGAAERAVGTTLREAKNADFQSVLKSALKRLAT